MQGQMGAGAPTSSQDYFNKYTQAVAANPTYQSLYNTANQLYNVPQLTQQAAQLQGEVAAIPSQVTAQGRGFDYSAPQLQNKMNWESMYLTPQSQMATQQAQAAQNLAGQYTGYGMQQNQLNLLPVQQQGQMLSDALARQSTGWTQAAQQEFAGLQAKMQSGVQLSQTEMDRANTLAQAQEAYQAAQLSASAQIQAAQIGQQYKTLGQGETLVSTGAVPGTQAGAYNPFIQSLVGQSTNIS